MKVLPGWDGSCFYLSLLITYICSVMDQNEINNNIISYLRPYNPERIGIFGSFAREEQTAASDIDILVRFRSSISLLDLVRIHRELSNILGRNIDLVTEASLKNEKLRSYIYKDLKVIYE